VMYAANVQVSRVKKVGRKGQIVDARRRSIRVTSRSSDRQ
jgi:hypothetical protein